MIQKGFKITEDDKFVMARYELTWNVGWENILDIMQIFLEDIKDKIQLIQYLPIAGAEGIDIDTIVNSNLWETPICREEHGGLSLAGHSKIMEMPIRITIYNQLRIVDIQVMLVNEGLKDEFLNNNHLLDNYLNSVEINGFRRNADRRGMNRAIDMFKKCFMYSEDFSEEEKNKSMKAFKDMSIYLHTDFLFKEKNDNE